MTPASPDTGAREPRRDLVSALTRAADALHDAAWVMRGAKTEPPLPAPVTLVLPQTERVESEIRELLAAGVGVPPDATKLRPAGATPDDFCPECGGTKGSGCLCPRHPGVFAQQLDVCLDATRDAIGMPYDALARAAGMEPRQLTRLLAGVEPVTAEVAERVGRMTGVAPRMWLALAGVGEARPAEPPEGLHGKYHGLRRTRDDSLVEGWYFVIREDDRAGEAALLAYADACESDEPELATDLRRRVRDEQLARGLYDAGWER